jgi:hypothetical protein
MDRCGLMQSLLQEYLAQPGAYRVWRGHNFGLQLHDYGTPLGDRGPEHFYRWLAGTVRSRPLPEPQVAVTDCLFAAQLLYEGDRADHLHALRQRLRAQGWPPADADLAAAPAWPAERITDTMTGLVLDLIGWHNPVPVDPRRWEALVTAFTPLLTAVTAEQYELIESLASRAPTCYPVEALRLHLLLLMARQRRPVTGPGRTVAQLLQMARNHLAPAEADALARTAEDAGYVVPPEPPAGPPFDEPWPPGAEEDIPF